MQMRLQSETEKIIFCCTSNMRYMYMYGTTRHKNRYLYHTYIVNVQAHQLVRFVGQQGSLHLVKIGWHDFSRFTWGQGERKSGRHQKT